MRRIGSFILLLALFLPTSLNATSSAPSFSPKEIPRDVYLQGEITENSTNEAATKLVKLDQEYPGREIILHITSPGGDVMAGLALYDTMKSIKSPVVTVCESYCMSMAAFILAAGDVRESTPHATIMVHTLAMSGIHGHLEEIRNILESGVRLQTMLDDIWVKQTGKTLEEVRKMEDHDHFMTPKEAKDLGIIDEIINPVKR